MNALSSLESSIHDLSLRSLESIFDRGLHSVFRSDDVLPNGRPPTIFAIERMYARETSDVDFLDHLVRSGWSLVSPIDDHGGATALHALVNLSASMHNVDQLFDPIARFLINCEELADINAPDCRANDGRTPLHWASSLNNWNASVPALLALGADPNVQDDKGSTPLHYAASNWSLDRVKLLVQHGAERSVRNNDGHTPTQEAERSLDRTKHGKTDAQRIVDYLASI